MTDTVHLENEAKWLEQQEEIQRNLDKKKDSRLTPESIYGIKPGEINIPKFGPPAEQILLSGLDLPTNYPRIPTLSEYNAVQKSLQTVENELLQREEYCRVCNAKFQHGYKAVCLRDLAARDHTLTRVQIKAHYETHRAKLVHRCPFCERNWTTLTVEVSPLGESPSLECRRR